MASDPRNPLLPSLPLDALLAQMLVERRLAEEGEPSDGDGLFRRALRSAEHGLSKIGDVIDVAVENVPGGGALNQFSTQLGQGAGSTITGALRLGGMALPGQDPLERAAERVRQGLDVERDRAGAPEGLGEKIAAGAGRVVGEALPAVIPAAGAARALSGAPRAIRAAGTAAAAFAPDAAIGAGLRPEESAAGTLGELTDNKTLRRISEDVRMRALAEGLAGLGAAGVVTAAGKGAGRVARGIRAGRALPEAATPSAPSRMTPPSPRTSTSPSAAAVTAPTTARVSREVDELAKRAGRAAAAAVGGATREGADVLGASAREAQRRASGAAAAVATEAVRDAARRAGGGEAGLEAARAAANDAMRSPGKWDRFMRAFRAVKLWNPLARIRDLGENLVMGGSEALKDIPAWMADLTIEEFDRLVAGGRYGGRVEGGPTVRGAAEATEATRRGARQLGREFRGEQKYILPERGTRYLESVGPPKSPAEMSRLEKFEQLGFKMAQAADAVGRPIAEARVARNMARAQGIREGLRGQALERRTLELMAKPTDEMLEEMSRQADLATFMADNALANWLREGVLEGKVGHYLQPFLPFTRAAANVTTRVLDYSPAGLVRGGREMDKLEKLAAQRGFLKPGEQELFQRQLRAQRRRAAQTAGRAATGTGIGTLGWVLADRVNSFYPPEFTPGATTERRRRYQAGEPHAAIKLGDRWVPLERGLGPVGVQLLVWKELRELSRQDEGTEPRTPEEHQDAMRRAVAKYGPGLVEFVSKTGVAPALAVAQAMYEVSPLPELQRLAETIRKGAFGTSDVERMAERQVRGMVPTGLGVLTKAVDPYKREVTNLGEAALSGIPGASRLLEPRLDPFGEPIPRPISGVGALDPFRTQTDRLKDDAFREELDRVGYALPPLERLSDQEPDEAYRARLEFTGPMVRDALLEVMASPDYVLADQAEQKKMLIAARSRAQREAKQLLGLPE